jgi:hypothetical protein
VLETDGEPYSVVMECTGDIDWYKIELQSLPKFVEIILTDIPAKSDFDIIAYDSNLEELEDGRSAQSGNIDEKISFTVTNDSLIYLKIYSYSGRGDATLTITAKKSNNQNNGGQDADFTQLTYEEVLFEKFPFYPRGSSVGILEQSVENLIVKPISCRIADTELTGELMIGQYAHVERELIESVDYIDGWALVVFNGSHEFLDMLTVTVRITIFAPGLDIEVKIPSSMEIDGGDYLISNTRKNVYYVSESYGDFLGNSRNDIRISSGVVGDLGELFSNDIFTQDVEIEWQFEDENGLKCSGRSVGKPIVDFKIGNNFRWFRSNTRENFPR